MKRHITLEHPLVCRFDASGELAGVEQRFREALAIDGRNPKTHFLLAKSLIARGQNDNARAEIDRALALKPGQPEFKELREQIDK